ncbi:MAG: hypothetical protein KIT78_04955 [Steroidobacteraceae bacterium]|nr:hypothetical protein [Steroidobacteraceae bacterium]
MTTANARGLRTLLGLAALFFVPLFLAFALYYGGGWRPTQSTNHGELLARPIRITASWPAEKWTLVQVGSGQCTDACRAALYVTRQTWLSLAKELDRVQRAFIAPADCCDAGFLADEHSALIRIDSAGIEGRALLAALPPGVPDRTIYLVDPLGNQVLAWPERPDVRGIARDLSRLLKASRIG